MNNDTFEKNTMATEVTRRRFLEVAGTAAVGSAISGPALAADKARPSAAKKELIWGYLIHLGFNFWYDRLVPQWRDWSVSDRLLCETDYWTELVNEMPKKGVNMAVIDLGEGVQYKSHPEIAIKGSWSRSQLLEELDRMRKLGVEPIPKLNFSAAHDTWLGKYERMVSTDVYYEVCGDLIAEVIELFDKPRFLHLGFDEETYQNQRFHNHATIRQFELWWHDFNFLVNEVAKTGVRPWMWSDYIHAQYGQHLSDGASGLKNQTEFLTHVPKSVLQSNWYHWAKFDMDDPRVMAFNVLDIHGYDQIPCGGNFNTPDSFGGVVRYCQKHLAPELIKGFLQSTWFPTNATARGRHFAALDQLANARAELEQAAA